MEQEIIHETEKSKNDIGRHDVKDGGTSTLDIDINQRIAFFMIRLSVDSRSPSPPPLCPPCCRL